MINIDNIIEDNKINKINDNLYLTNKDIKILKKYNIDYLSSTLEELLFKIEMILNEEHIDELENVSLSISEFNYYHNTNK